MTTVHDTDDGMSRCRALSRVLTEGWGGGLGCDGGSGGGRGGDVGFGNGSHGGICGDMSVVTFSPLDMAMAVAAAKGMWLICSRKRSSFTKRRTQVASKKLSRSPCAREEESTRSHSQAS